MERGVQGVEERVGRTGAERVGTRRDRGLVTIGWPLCPRMPRMADKKRQRRAFGKERRTVAVRRLDLGDK